MGSHPGSPSAAVGRVRGAATGVLEHYLALARERVSRHREYPYLARRARLQGKVCLRLTISASGQLKDARSTCGGSHPALLEAARRAVADATPFAPLPSALGPELTFEVPVVFELTE
jgi:protein TonB